MNVTNYCIILKKLISECWVGGLLDSGCQTIQLISTFMFEGLAEKGRHSADFERKNISHYHLPFSAFHSLFESREKEAHKSA